jgi:sn-glycerol 3-phosphate transport system substrate-binding protein
MLSFPFNSSTTVFHYNKDAFKAAGLDPRSRPPPGPKWPGGGKTQGQRSQVPVHDQLGKLDPAGELLAWHNTEFATKGNGLRGMDARLKLQQSAARAPHRKPGQHGQERPVRLQGRGNAPTPRSCRANAP